MAPSDEGKRSDTTVVNDTPGGVSEPWCGITAVISRRVRERKAFDLHEFTINRTDFRLFISPSAFGTFLLLGYRRIISVGHDLCVVPLVPIYDMRCDINDGAWFIGGFGTTRRSFPTRGLAIFYDRKNSIFKGRDFPFRASLV